MLSFAGLLFGLEAILPLGWTVLKSGLSNFSFSLEFMVFRGSHLLKTNPTAARSAKKMTYKFLAKAEVQRLMRF